MPAVWVPAKIARIAILGSRLGLKGLVKRLLSGILVMLVVKVVVRTSPGGGASLDPLEKCRAVSSKGG